LKRGLKRERCSGAYSHLSRSVAYRVGALTPRPDLSAASERARYLSADNKEKQTAPRRKRVRVPPLLKASRPGEGWTIPSMQRQLCGWPTRDAGSKIFCLCPFSFVRKCTSEVRHQLPGTSRPRRDGSRWTPSIPRGIGGICNPFLPGSKKINFDLSRATPLGRVLKIIFLLSP
jgi:hypothetical protein